MKERNFSTSVDDSISIPRRRSRFRICACYGCRPLGVSGGVRQRDCSTDRIDRTRIPRWMLIRAGSSWLGLPNNIPPAHPETTDSGFVARKTPSRFMNGIKQL